MQLFCKEMIKVPFNRQYALSIQNEKKLPHFFRTYDNNDYENCFFGAQPHTFQYTLKPPSLNSIALAYYLKEKNLEKLASRTSGANMYPESQILFINSMNKSQQESDTKDHLDNLMFFS